MPLPFCPFFTSLPRRLETPDDLRYNRLAEPIPDPPGTMRRIRLVATVMTLAALTAVGCVDGEDPRPGKECEWDRECPGAQTCESGACVDPRWRIGPDAAIPPDTTPPDDTRPPDPDTRPAGPYLEADQQVEFTAEDGESTWKLLQLENTGDERLEIRTVQLLRGPEFKVTYPSGDPGPPARDHDWNLPVVVDPGGTNTIRLWYEPDDDSADRATLSMQSNATNSPHRIALVGDTD